MGGEEGVQPGGVQELDAAQVDHDPGGASISRPSSRWS